MTTIPVGRARWDARSRMWLATSHADCSAVLRDPRLSAAAGQRERARDDDLPPSRLTTDAPDHQRLRAPGALLLGAAAVGSVKEGIADDLSGLLGSLTGEGADPHGDGLGVGLAAGRAEARDDRTAGLTAEHPDARDDRTAGLVAGRTAEPAAAPLTIEAVDRLGKPFATAVLSRLFGIAEDERPAFAALAEAASVNLDPLADPTAAARGRVAMGELLAYLGRQADTAAACPLATLAADGRLSRPELLGVLSLTVVGGWQPLAEMVGNALFWLLPRPELGKLLIASEPSEARLLVDELLRLEAPIPFTMRVAVEDVTLPSGAEVPAGSRVLVVLSSANRDPAVFERPDDLVPDRSPNPHLAFGDGPHWCLGAQLVRTAGALFLPELFRRFPGTVLGPGAAWDPRPIPRRLLRCPITLGEWPQ
jgi:cytochrome P450